jgi:hypothetical protein
MPLDKMNNVPLRSIAFSYPGFQSLPRGIKQMLVVTETFLFGEDNDHSAADRSLAQLNVTYGPSGPAQSCRPELLARLRRREPGCLGVGPTAELRWLQGQVPVARGGEFPLFPGGPPSGLAGS